MPVEVVIRPYKLSDRPAVRQICSDTADCGKPVESIFPNREVFADLLMNYYTDLEPETLWVAEYEGRVIGYLAGCLDTRRSNQMIAWHIIPKVITRAIMHGLFSRRKTWQMLKALVCSWQRGGFNRNIPLDSYPAHLHVNVKEGFRGQHIGRSLVERFFEQVKAAGIKGIHLSVNGENTLAGRFFEEMGFVVLSRYPMMLFTNNSYRFSCTVIYVKQL